MRGCHRVSVVSSRENGKKVPAFSISMAVNKIIFINMAYLSISVQGRFQPIRGILRIRFNRQTCKSQCFIRLSE